MGMSTDMAPRYISMNSTSQMTYVLDTGNINLAQVQLAVPASEIVLIQEENKSINLCDSPVLVADVGADNVSWIGNNVIVLVSQPQEYVMLEQEVVNSNVGQTWQVEGLTTAVLAQKGSTTENEELVEVASASTAEDAKCWFRDSLITTAALSTLTTYVQSNGSAKVG